MDNREQAQEEALAAYTEAYKDYNSISITQEQSAIRLKEASRQALDLGIPLQHLRDARRRIDMHAEFMTDWK